MLKLTKRLLRIAACTLGLWGAVANADTITFWVNAPMAPNPSAPIYEEIRAFEARRLAEQPWLDKTLAA
jgi:hypothetical protein